MPTINTKQDYWNIIDQNFTNIVNIFKNVGFPIDNNIDPYGNILDQSAYQTLVEMKESRDADIAKWLTRIWKNAPDRAYIHSWEGWGTFCDLCDNTWVLY